MNCPTCGKAQKKTDAQRNLFHSLCRQISQHCGETPGKVKESIKADFFGIDEYRIGKRWYRAVRPSEKADKEEYSELIEFTYVWAVDNLDLVLK